MKRFCVVLFVVVSVSAVAQNKVAIIRQSTGDVSVRHGTQWTAVTQTPVDLFDGDKVASDRVRAEIFYPGDGSTLTVDVGSNVTIHQVQNNSGGWLNRVKVYVGDVFFHISKTAETHNTWQLATPTAVGGVQGTEGQIHVEDEENSDFTLSEGALEVQHVNANGVPVRDEKPVRIGAGESVQAKPGAALARAKALRQVKIPRADVKPSELPAPKPGHYMRTRQSERPPRAMGGAGGRSLPLNNANPARPNAIRPGEARPNAQPRQTSPRETSPAPGSTVPKQSVAPKAEESKPNEAQSGTTSTDTNKKEENNKEEKSKPVRRGHPRRRA